MQADYTSDTFVIFIPNVGDGTGVVKSADVFRTLIETSSSEGDFLLDPFCGAGLFLQAAEVLGRRWVGIQYRTGAN